MYKVKRFSKIYYCQKNYGLLGNIGKKYRKMALNKVDDSIRNSHKIINSTLSNSSKIDSKKTPKNFKLKRSLIRELKNTNTRVINNSFEGISGPQSNYTLRSKDLNENIINDLKNYNPRLGKKIENAAKKSNELIFHNPKSGNEYLAHEIGHAMNRNSKNPISRAISRSETAINHSYINMTDKKGILNALKGFIKGKVKLHEESNASKNAMKLLRRNGASKEEMSISKDNLDKALVTYKEGSKLSYLYPLKNTLENKI